MAEEDGANRIIEVMLLTRKDTARSIFQELKRKLLVEYVHRMNAKDALDSSTSLAILEIIDKVEADVEADYDAEIKAFDVFINKEKEEEGDGH